MSSDEQMGLKAEVDMANDVPSRLNKERQSNRRRGVCFTKYRDPELSHSARARGYRRQQQQQDSSTPPAVGKAQDTDTYD